MNKGIIDYSPPTSARTTLNILDGIRYAFNWLVTLAYVAFVAAIFWGEFDSPFIIASCGYAVAWGIEMLGRLLALPLRRMVFLDGLSEYERESGFKHKLEWTPNIHIFWGGEIVRVTELPNYDMNAADLAADY